MTLSTTNGFILVRCLSSKDSRTTKRGKDEIEVSLSESLSGQSRLDIFEEAIELLKFSSDVLPTHPGALQGDVLRGKTHSPQQHQGYTSEILILGNVLFKM